MPQACGAAAAAAALVVLLPELRWCGGGAQYTAAMSCSFLLLRRKHR
jgi:hypothetical protein